MRRIVVCVALAASALMAVSCSGDEKDTDPVITLDAGADLPEAEDMPRLADNGCPLPPDGTCVDEYACTEDGYEIDAVTCEVTCINAPRCVNADGCCAPGCNPSNDSDCEPGCGNAYLEAGELCDGDCPESAAACEVPDSCSMAILVGSAETCDARCFVLPIDRCTDDDGCCPSGCVSDNDNDCSAPRLALGDVCTSSHQCPDVAGKPGICLGAEWANDQESICTQSCGAESDCPNAWSCVDEVCLPPCSDSSECTTGLTCTSANIALPPEYCDYLPWHPGTTGIGTACEHGYECRGRTDILGGGCLTEAASGWSGGYCTMSICETDSDCTSEGACISGTCFQKCRAAGECRPGYECNDFFGVAKRICSPPVLNVATGRECMSETDCLGTSEGRTCLTDLPGGYCSSPCTTNEECPYSAVCDTNLGQCMASCPTGNCRDGYSCVDIGAGAACYPARGGSRGAGSSCSSGTQCYGYDGLYPSCLGDADGFSGGYCTAIGCTADSECGTDNVCLSLGGDQGQCFLGCTAGEECRPGYVCEERDGKNVCLPGGGGDRPVGAACADDSQCSGECISELENANALGGYCTQSCGGESDPECPTGSHCVTGECYPDCQPMAGVDTCERQGYLCRDLDQDFSFECVPNGGDGTQELGEVCTRDWQCARAGAVCGTVGDGDRLCAVTCQMGFCPTGSSCDVSTNLCLPNCETTGECRTGFTCLGLPDASDGSRVCDYGIFRLGF